MIDPSLITISLILISLVAGLIHSAIGFGFGIVAIALLPIAIDAKSAHIIVSVCSVPMLIMAAWTYRSGAQKIPLLISTFGACIALPAGVYLFEVISLDLLVRLTGLGVLMMAISSSKPLKIRQTNSTNATHYAPCLSAGIISGFLAGAVSIAGPPIAAFAIRQNWRANQYKAFMAQFLLVIASFKAGLLGLRDHVNLEIGYEILIASIFSMIGVRMGEKVSRNLDADKLKHLVAAVLIAVAVFMMLRGNA